VSHRSNLSDLAVAASFAALLPCLCLSAFAAEERHSVALEEIPDPVLEGLDSSVAERLREARSLVQELRGSADRVAVAEAFGDLGRLYHTFEMTDGAVAAYTNATRLSPSDFRWRYLLSVVLGDRGPTERAAEEILEALAIEPSYQAALIYAGELYSELQQPDRAEAFLRGALEIEPRSAAALAGMGQIALSRRRYSEAVDLLRQALDYQPNATRLHYPLALAYRGLGENDTARNHLEASGVLGAKVADPILEEVNALRDFERAHRLGLLAFQEGRYEDAADAYRLALVIDPDSRMARNSLASALSAQSSEGFFEAVSELERAIRRSPEDRALRMKLFRLLHSLDTPAAKTQAEKADREKGVEPQD
jgi:tetratricopeptide (TPR) repeat protein